ncbi:26905_t:CDS:2 [Dentiscutata erythropus]|uniref:26905_t:CDS:1 n=1 Tax=Dentiscutata erythropus TaxID=1348616 RepID=A0A9N9IR23_9GLOM|nr:26905_t:CDS:2 [Dentiscutata erythropus]
MSALSINIFIVGITNQTIKNNDDNISLEFYIKKKVRNKEPSNFWIEAKYSVNNKYLSNKTAQSNDLNSNELNFNELNSNEQSSTSSTNSSAVNNDPQILTYWRPLTQFQTLYNRF